MVQKYIVNDIVMYKNRIHTIIDTLRLNNYELSYVRHPVNQAELSGVHITPEILDKNGWEHKDDIYFKEFPHRKLVIMDENAYIINECCSMFLCPAKFVSQLQHLLFGLGLNSEMDV